MNERLSIYMPVDHKSMKYIYIYLIFISNNNIQIFFKLKKNKLVGP